MASQAALFHSENLSACCVPGVPPVLNTWGTVDINYLKDPTALLFMLKIPFFFIWLLVLLQEPLVA